MSQLVLDLTAEKWVTPYGDRIPPGTLTACYAYHDPDGELTHTARWECRVTASREEGLSKIMGHPFSTMPTRDVTRDGDSIIHRHPHGGTTIITFEEAP